MQSRSRPVMGFHVRAQRRYPKVRWGPFQMSPGFMQKELHQVYPETEVLEQAGQPALSTSVNRTESSVAVYKPPLTLYRSHTPKGNSDLCCRNKSTTGGSPRTPTAVSRGPGLLWCVSETRKCSAVQSWGYYSLMLLVCEGQVLRQLVCSPT